MGAIRILNHGQSVSITAVQDLELNIPATVYQDAELDAPLTLPHLLTNNEIVYTDSGDKRLSFSVVGGDPPTLSERVQAQPSFMQTIDIPGAPRPELDSVVINQSQVTDLVADLATKALATDLPEYPSGARVTVAPRPVWLDVRDFGAVGDRSTLCTTAIQTAIDQANAAGGGTVAFPDGWWRANNLVLKPYVTLLGFTGTRPYLGGAAGGGRSGAIIEAPPGITGGWVIDTPATNSYMMAIKNLGVKGSSGGGATGGIRFRDSDNGLIEQVSTYWTSEQGIYLVAGNCNHLSGVFPLGALMATRSANAGAIHFGPLASDNTLEKWEATTGVAIGGAPADANLYNAALMIEGGTNFIFGGQAELSDVGVRVTGIQNKFAAVRADNNAGHGWIFSGNKNQLIGCQSLNNGYVDNTYDGYRCEATYGHGNFFIGCQSNRNDGHTNRYAFADDVNIGLVEFKNQWVGCRGSQWATSEFSTHSFLGSGVNHSPHPMRPVDGTTVIDVTGTTFVLLNAYVTNTTVTNFTGGTPGQTVRFFGDTEVTIANNSTIKTNTGADKMLASNKMYRFTYYSGVWYEDA